MKLLITLSSALASFQIAGCLPVDPFSDYGDDNNGGETIHIDPDNGDNSGIPLNSDPVDPNNKFRSSDIKRFYLAGSFLGGKKSGEDESLVLNFDQSGKELSNVEVDVESEQSIYKIQLPARVQQVVDIDESYFALLRYSGRYDDKPDAHLVRKVDGKTWKISPNAVNPTSFSVANVGNERRIYFAASTYDYQGPDFWQEKTGDFLKMVRAFDNKDEVSLLSVLDNSFGDYALVGNNGVAIDNSLNHDTWISFVTSANPVPYDLAALDTYFDEYLFTNNTAFRLFDSDGPQKELRRMDDHPIHGTVVGKVDVSFDDLDWGARVADLFILNSWRTIIVLDGNLQSVVKTKMMDDYLNHPIAVKEAGGFASLFDKEIVCQFRKVDAAVQEYCVKAKELDLRGTLTAIEVDNTGKIFAFSSVESVNDVEKLTLEVDAANNKLVLTGREQVTAYQPATTILVPVKL